MTSGWNLWVWLECIGVVSGCCKEVYRFPHNITYPYSTCITVAFLQQHPYFFCSLLKYFFILVIFINDKKITQVQLYHYMSCYYRAVYQILISYYTLQGHPHNDEL